jgi:hypothetical protein
VRVLVLTVVGLAYQLTALAGAAPTARPSPKPVWIGVFDPKLPAHPPWDNAKLTPVEHAGTVRVLTPDNDAPPASGEVVVVHPLLAKTATGKVDRGEVTLADFAFDQRDGDDGVVVLPAGTPVAFVPASKADSAAIATAVVSSAALAKVHRALAGLEIATVDLDGDGKPDLATTYGCSNWFDGACQSRGQFVLVRRNGRWVIVE